ncbi:unnamed protein product [Prorocentrum cordatum]|uniref:Secreted protein n=1 Tax=Prorocentrum cordatum TaxID=2364126 RepID=A0ABN9QSJ4_9DINO|nr:unnamed protein product [Polarella glacialis]
MTLSAAGWLWPSGWLGHAATFDSCSGSHRAAPATTQSKAAPGSTRSGASRSVSGLAGAAGQRRQTRCVSSRLSKAHHRNAPRRRLSPRCVFWACLEIPLHEEAPLLHRGGRRACRGGGSKPLWGIRTLLASNSRLHRQMGVARARRYTLVGSR